jgi:hypothetical protein
VSWFPRRTKYSSRVIFTALPTCSLCSQFVGFVSHWFDELRFTALPSTAVNQPGASKVVASIDDCDDNTDPPVTIMVWLRVAQDSLDFSDIIGYHQHIGTTRRNQVIVPNSRLLFLQHEAVLSLLCIAE